MKKISCGTIVTNGSEILIGHATKTKWWSIPKGIFEKNKDVDYVHCASRELEEETGLIYQRFLFKDLGKFEYLKDKDLYLFLVFDEDLQYKNFKCKSYFTDFLGKQIPEFDKFMVCPIHKYGQYLNPSLIKVMIEVESNLSFNY